MIVIDAREGVSGDMLLAAMLGGLGVRERERVFASIARACEARALVVHLVDIEDQGQRGLGISYRSKEPEPEGVPRDECYARLAGIEEDLGSTSATARKILDHIFDAEAEAHGVSVGEVHLHEMGRTQALVNIAGIGLASGLLEDEGKDGFRSSVITTGGGWVVVSHGAIRVPAPVSVILLRGLKHQTGDSPGERATPTGIAAVKALATAQVDRVPEPWTRRSVGFGTKRFAGRLGRTALVWP